MTTEDKLTPAAHSALQELVSDYRAQILMEAHRAAAGLTVESREISVRDLLEAVLRAQSRPRGADSRNLLDRLLFAYFISGMIATIGAVLFLAIQSLQDFSRIDSLEMPVLVALTGIVISFTSYAMLRLFRRTREQRMVLRIGRATSDDLASQFLDRWLEIELGTRTWAAAALGESTAQAGVSVLLRSLHDIDQLNVDDLAVFRKLLDLRNRIVHGHRVPNDDIREALKDTDHLLNIVQVDRRPPA